MSFPEAKLSSLPTPYAKSYQRAFPLVTIIGEAGSCSGQQAVRMSFRGW